MPAVTPHSNALILVSGAAGFIATHIIQQLLESGYRVRGTVRSEEKTPYLKSLFEKFGDALEVMIVPDITKEGAFDEAVKGVDAILHTASPIGFGFDDPQEAIAPALHGTIGILKSAVTYGSTVKRIVITSSIASLHQNPINITTPTVFSESDKNMESVKLVEKLGRDATAIDKYYASKVLADEAVWKMWEEQKNEVGWDLVSIHPSVVLGPIMQEVASAQALNASNLMFWLVVVAGMDSSMAAGGGEGWIDVRDVALMHKLALEKPEAAGQRVIANAGAFKWQDFLDVANAMQPPPYSNMAKGSPGAGQASDVQYTIRYDSAQAEKVFGLGKEIKYRTLQETAQDTLLGFKAKGLEL